MCGRCVIARDPTSLRRCCAGVSYPYKGAAPPQAEAACKDASPSDPSCDLPAWYQGCESRYRPSYNVCPKDSLPVLLSSDQPHICEGESTAPGGRVLQMMQWGLIPSWHKGPAAQFSYLLNNCRSESLLDKASFRNAYTRDYRCVIPLDGFYEWKTMDKKKYPHYVHSEEKDRLLMVAGIFDVHRESDTPPLYTVTLITTNTVPRFSEIHSRMPALLEGEQQVSDWLDFKRVSGQEAYPMIMPTTRLVWYPVGPSVNNVYYKGEECMKGTTTSESPRKEKPKGLTLDNFFKRTPVKRKSEESRDLKRIKSGDEKET